MKSLLSLLLFFAFSSAFGQLEQTKRIEFEHNPNIDEEHQVIPLGENGVLLLHSKVEVYRKNMTLNFYKYDTTLTENWHATYDTQDRFELVRTFHNQHFLYLLFRQEESVNISILRLDFDSGDKSFTEGKIPANMDIEQFVVLKSKAFIGGKFNERPVVVAYSLFDNSSKVLPELHANNLIINDLDINENTENVFVMLKNERNCQFILKTFSYEGKLLSSAILGEKSKNPISGKILQIQSDEMLMTGNYASGCTEFSEGIYLHHLGQGKTQFINFSELSNFFKYLKPKREQKIKAKISLKKQKGKEMKFQYRLLLHDIIPQENGFLMVAEIFYPEYKPPSNIMFNSLRSYRIGTDVYNNFRYTHAIICKFDKTGKLLWDNSFGLENLESDILNQKVQITPTGDFFVMAFPKGGLIRAELIKGGENVKEIESFSLKTNSEEEKIADTNKTNLAAWYNKHFLAYGYQTLRKDKGFSANRDVFYMNKLSYAMKNVE